MIRERLKCFFFENLFPSSTSSKIQAWLFLPWNEVGLTIFFGKHRLKKTKRFIPAQDFWKSKTPQIYWLRAHPVYQTRVPPKLMIWSLPSRSHWTNLLLLLEHSVEIQAFCSMYRNLDEQNMHQFFVISIISFLIFRFFDNNLPILLWRCYSIAF